MSNPLPQWRTGSPVQNTGSGDDGPHSFTVAFGDIVVVVAANGTTGDPASYTLTATNCTLSITELDESNAVGFVTNNDVNFPTWTYIWVVDVLTVTLLGTHSVTVDRNSASSVWEAGAILPGVGGYHLANAGGLVRTGYNTATFSAGGATDVIDWNETGPFPENKAMFLLLVGRGSASGRYDFDMDDSGGRETTATTGINNGRVRRGGFGGSDSLANTVIADAFIDYPGWLLAGSNGIPFHIYNNTGPKSMVALLFTVERTFETAIEIEEALPIEVLKSLPIEAAEEIEAVGNERGDGVVPIFGLSVRIALEYEDAPTVQWLKTSRLNVGLTNPGPGPFTSHVLRAWMFKDGGAAQVRLTLLDGTTVIQSPSAWTALTDTEAAYTLNLLASFAARSTLRALVEVRTDVGVAVTVTQMELECRRELGVAEEIEEALDFGVSVPAVDFRLGHITL